MHRVGISRQKGGTTMNIMPMPMGPVNLFARFIAPNPITPTNPIARYPQLHPSAFVSPFASIIGDVRVGGNVFIAPNTSLRADEGTPFYIESDTNLQDGVILHGLAHERFQINGREFSIYIGKKTSIAHGAIVHGPRHKCNYGIHQAKAWRMPSFLI
jgi:acyl-[acyl carrier protein]--UDP-N-acetylglucosamine O-acyltransferase